MTDLPFAHGTPPLHARMREAPEDFVVEEVLGYQADGEGEHVLLTVQKRGLTTDQAAQALARFAGVKPLAVGYAGMKDRHAVTRQAFSVQLAGKPEPDWSALAHSEIQVLAHARHRRKLKRGALAGNRFVLTLRNVAGDIAHAEETLRVMAEHGVPNYFGEQRFGRSGDNVAQARAMFAGQRVDRKLRGLLLSAARSHVFNAVLAERVRAQTWNQPLVGEIWCLARSRSWFGPEPFTPELAQRLQSGDIHPSGPLWGRDDLPSSNDAAELERAVAEQFTDLTKGIAAAGMDHDRRPLRLQATELVWRWLANDILELSFQLSAGAYATTLIRELIRSD